MQLVSFDEFIACMGALTAGYLVHLLGRNRLASPRITSGLVGLSVGVVLAIVSTTRFVLRPDNIAYGSMFWSASARLDDIEEVTVQPTLGVIPGRLILFRLRSGSQVTMMTGTRIGVLSWPSAHAWTEAANAAIRRRAEILN
jgi:tetrahydromethanopterin S-methyltransferase subunit F